jgi:hypothetical protein
MKNILIVLGEENYEAPAMLGFFMDDAAGLVAARDVAVANCKGGRFDDVCIYRAPFGAEIGCVGFECVEKH